MTKPLKLESVTCGVCGADDWQAYALGQDYEYLTSSDEFSMVKCQVCSNIYLNPRPIVDELPTIYPSNYYAYNYELAISPIAIRAKNWLDRIKVKQWLKYLPDALPQVLDVGCGDGRYLEMLHNLGIPRNHLYGVEMSEDRIGYLNDLGFKGYYGRIEDIKEDLPPASFDLIILLQVLEHVENPRTLMQSLAGLLKQGGILIIETPNAESLDFNLFCHGYWGGYHFPRHWNLMNRQTLTRLTLEYNLEVKSFNYLSAHSFCIFSLHHLIKYKWRSPWLASIFNPYQNLILLAFFTAFDLFRAKLGFQTSNIQLVAVKL